MCTPGVTINQLGTECQGREGNLSGSGGVSGDTTEEVLWSGELPRAQYGGSQC